jgi:nucleolar GTP-binding protein
MSQGMQELEDLYELGLEAKSLESLSDIQKDLRRIPIIELHTPTVVLIGSPNVGKSSIVRAVSTGTPEVNDYPFTTRGVTIGHIVDISRNLRFQVMDTPGLLDRPEEERNEMERLTFASLAHLPTAVIFVLDVSGLSGKLSSLQAQLNVRNYLKSRFPKRPWIDVVSKADLEMSEEIKALLPEGYISVSVQQGVNIEYLKQRIEDLLIELRQVLIQRDILKT